MERVESSMLGRYDPKTIRSDLQAAAVVEPFAGDANLFGESGKRLITEENSNIRLS